MAFILLLGSNLWLWRILLHNFLVGIVVIIFSVLLFGRVKGWNEVSYKVILSFFFLLLIFQWQTTQKVSLTYLDNDEQRVQQMRLREYPPVFFRLGETTVWIPIAHWLEGRKESIAFFRILRNVSETIDPNLYFFANHPRERIGVREFEKFSYILLPFFLLGLFRIVGEKKKVFLWLFISCILPFSVIGHKNTLGPFMLLPFIIIPVVIGIEFVYRRLFLRMPRNFHKPVFLSALVIFVLVILQQVAYEIY